MSTAIIPLTGRVVQLDGKPTPDEQVTEAQAADPGRVSRVLMRLLADVALLKRRWSPDQLTFPERTVDASGVTKHRFPHGLGQRVRWWPVDWVGAAGPQLARHADSDLNTLVLVSYSAGTVAIRVEVSG